MCWRTPPQSPQNLVDGLPPAPSFGHGRYQVDATKYLVELFGIDALEEFRRRMELVRPPGQKGQICDF
eukprot:4454174-Pyramimonas_sp.AAC.1